MVPCRAVPAGSKGKPVQIRNCARSCEIHNGTLSVRHCPQGDEKAGAGTSQKTCHSQVEQTGSGTSPGLNVNLI